MILMVVAVGCGLAASYMTSQLLAERGKAGPDDSEEKVKVLVAKKNLELGLLIDKPEEVFKIKLYLKGQEPEKALTDADIDKLKDHRLSKPLKTDEFVTAQDLIDKNQNTLSARLPKGMRAVGIKVSIEQIASGFASLPMSHVDVISVLRRGDTDSVSQILLEDVLVLAADAETGRGDGKNAMPATTVTLALSPEDAELVTLASEMGSLRLILRAFGDNTPAKTKGVKGDVIVKGSTARERSRLERAYESDPTSPQAKRWLKMVKEVKEQEKAKAAPKETEKPAPTVVVKNPEVKSTVGTPLVKSPEPVKNPEVTPVDEKPEPKTFTHILTIYNGDHGKRHAYKLDENGKVIEPEITKIESETPAPLFRTPRQPAKRPG
jgi:pilus assembly protein CpaB